MEKEKKKEIDNDGENKEIENNAKKYIKKKQTTIERREIKNNVKMGNRQ